jgi:hypothetical protein
MARWRDVPDDLLFVPQEPVQWLAPRELVDAGIRVVLSSAFGEYADKREFEQLFDAEVFECDAATDATWVDYVADLGDGFDATHSIAELLASPALDVTDADGVTHTLPRAATVVLGGDQVYPTADIEQYTNRLIGPYRAALDHTDPPDNPRIFAIPGNHDWYDGLTSFVRVFCFPGWLGGWRLPQHRSYFALQLTNRWWLWGVDIQFDGYIDKYQVEYFQHAAERLGDDVGLILCSAKPAWAHGTHLATRPTPSMRNLDYLVDTCVPDGVPVRVQLAGDWHHYARYIDETTGDHYITSGGGGAYTSATHQLPDDITLRRRTPPGASPDDPADDARLQRQPITFPDQGWSARRRVNSLFAGWWNPTFAFLVGAVYVLLGLVSLSGSRSSGSFAERVEALHPRHTFEAYWTGLVSSPIGWILVGLFGAALVGLTSVGKLPHPWHGVVAGVVHAVAHLAVASVCVWMGVLVVSWFGDPTDIVTWTVWSVVVFTTGTALGSATFGAYLGVADWVAGINTNELFAAQHIERFKHFLRMRVTDDEIEVFVIGLDACPRWELDDTADPTERTGRFRRRAGDESAPRVVERFTIRRQRS